MNTSLYKEGISFDITSKFKWSALFLMATCALFLCSCYHIGYHSSAKTVHILEIENKSNEASVGAMLKKCLHEQFGTRPGLKTTSKGDYTLDVVVKSLDTRSNVRASLRDKDARDDKSDAYQTVLYTLELVVDYTLTPKNGGKALQGTVKAKASMARMHDRNIALQNACLQAANDAARQIADNVIDF